MSSVDGGKSAGEDRVGDGVKCCTKVKEDEDGERTGISWNKEVIRTRLERVIKGILCKMCV